MKTCDSCTRPEVCQTSGWCHRAEEKADDRLHPTAGSEARAEVIKRITGMVASIEVGEFVRVTRIDGTTCTVERETWRGSMVTLNNCIVGAPLNHLKFCPQNVGPLPTAPVTSD